MGAPRRWTSGSAGLAAAENLLGVLQQQQRAKIRNMTVLFPEGVAPFSFFFPEGVAPFSFFFSSSLFMLDCCAIAHVEDAAMAAWASGGGSYLAAILVR